MKLDLKKIVQAPGASVSFDYPLDLSQFDWNGPSPLREPGAVSGTVRNMAGALVLHADMTARLYLTCDPLCQALLQGEAGPLRDPSRH